MDHFQSILKPLKLRFTSQTQPYTHRTHAQSSLPFLTILENETKVGCGHKGEEGGARSEWGRKTHPFRRQQPSKPSGWLATRPFVGKLIDITKFKCARQRRRRSGSNEFPYLHSWEVGEKEEIQMLLKNDQPLYQ